LQAAPIGRRLFIEWAKSHRVIDSLAMPAWIHALRRGLVYSIGMASTPNPAIAHIYPGRATGIVTRVAPGTKNFVPRFPRPAQRRRRPPSPVRQALVALFGLGVCLTLGVLGTDEFLARRAAAATSAAVVGSQIYVGSILFFPDGGNRCHQMYFNNQDGQFSDNGSVDCTRAVAESTKDAPKTWSVARTAVISKGFR
jgi:hypothetical protein